ncbi:peroxiredoxin [Faunimonas sp. B44]|uniref:peroxiredoxin n=1 Tax=Faunimonas sp. B44 TaxID=3461493 RepID=UPI0040449023
MTIAVGERLPETDFFVLNNGRPQKISSREIFAGRKVVLFGVPGAFTPTCSLNHLPGFLEQHDAILEKGVDEIVVVAVNDANVMDAWSESTGGKGRIRYLSDGNADFATATGLDQDSSGVGRGTRMKRFAMIVEDGVVRTLDVEDNSGEAVRSSAARILEQL